MNITEMRKKLSWMGLLGRPLAELPAWCPPIPQWLTTVWEQVPLRMAPLHEPVEWEDCLTLDASAQDAWLRTWGSDDCPFVLFPIGPKTTIAIEPGEPLSSGSRQPRPTPSPDVARFGPDFLAHYLPMRFHPLHAWGIHVRGAGIVELASLVANVSPDDITEFDANLAFQLLMNHELHHATTELVLASPIEIANRREVYRPYFESGAGYYLEEGMAEANALRRAPSSEKWRIREDMHNMPPGYRDFWMYERPADFAAGLQAQVDIMGRQLSPPQAMPAPEMRSLLTRKHTRQVPSWVILDEPVPGLRVVHSFPKHGRLQGRVYLNDPAPARFHVFDIERDEEVGVGWSWPGSEPLPGAWSEHIRPYLVEVAVYVDRYRAKLRSVIETVFRWDRLRVTQPTRVETTRDVRQQPAPQRPPAPQQPPVLQQVAAYQRRLQLPEHEARSNLIELAVRARGYRYERGQANRLSLRLADSILVHVDADAAGAVVTVEPPPVAAEAVTAVREFIWRFGLGYMIVLSSWVFGQGEYSIEVRTSDDCSGVDVVWGTLPTSSWRLERPADDGPGVWGLSSGAWNEPPTVLRLSPGEGAEWGCPSSPQVKVFLPRDQPPHVSVNGVIAHERSIMDDLAVTLRRVWDEVDRCTRSC